MNEPCICGWFGYCANSGECADKFKRAKWTECLLFKFYQHAKERGLYEFKPTPSATEEQRGQDQQT